MTPYWQDEGVTLYHGDAREIVPALDYACVLTDPPYGIGVNYGPLSDDTHAAFLQHAAWLAALDAPTAFTLPSTKVYDIPRPDWLGVWHKPMTFGFLNTPLIPHWEAIAFFRLSGKIGRSDVWQHNPMKRNGHPTPKPLPLWCELLAVLPDGVVLDPFVGSGTTLLAARRLGRPAIGIDINADYLDLARRRLEAQPLPLPLEAV